MCSSGCRYRARGIRSTLIKVCSYVARCTDQTSTLPSVVGRRAATVQLKKTSTQKQRSKQVNLQRTLAGYSTQGCARCIQTPCRLPPCGECHREPHKTRRVPSMLVVSLGTLRGCGMCCLTLADTASTSLCHAIFVLEVSPSKAVGVAFACSRDSRDTGPLWHGHGDVVWYAKHDVRDQPPNMTTGPMYVTHEPTR